TTLFAALNVLEGKVIGQCMKRHRHQEFIRFLNVIEARVSKKKTIHAIVDNYATHKHPDVIHLVPQSSPASRLPNRPCHSVPLRAIVPLAPVAPLWRSVPSRRSNLLWY